MKSAVILLVLSVLAVHGEERGSLEFSLGGGLWMPALLESDAQLDPGPAFLVSLRIPPSLGNVFVIQTGYLSASSGRDAYDGIAGIPLTVGYRMYPMYRRFAGPRGIEPLLGIYGGGMLLWDSPAGNQDASSTGAAVIGAELGARVGIGESASLDLVVSPEWVGAGSSVAGEGKDLTGLRLSLSVVF
ncbi:MAG: hypothetical protein AVO35_09455 [Candidatus Aegiribacteria sp. MLS_C]|nr:MAG: hypothetical protein AVO35_09455 [Candidatus Aegiribacteria sp. MLS_C]